MLTITPCVFCDIVAGKAQSSIIHEDESVLALMTIAPANSGHTLVITKKHFATLREMDEETGEHLFKVTMRIARALRNSGIKCEGINLFLADGEPQQEILHIHMHVIPRFKEDTFRIQADTGNRPSRVELNKTAKMIHKAYAEQ